MRQRRLLIAAVAVGFVLAGLGGGWEYRRWAAQAIDPDDEIQVARGAELYAAQCARCHGAGLQGEPDWQRRKPNGELPAPPHDASGHSWHHPNEYLFAVTKHGMARFVPPDYKSAMPSYVGILSDAEIRAVIAFIQSTWPPEIRGRQAAISAR
ncbi:c-type cytochrome [Magnetospirillum fulvum]|uniref:Cytochrome c, mono-and diheme variants n=1 Tax=Magnetospirillum fulvum TaxID=1082 RepID=A0A1H6HRS5_MAGFU|nr:cytochrome c [Magnetospirillum fulvum]SEH36874.1 Cytochrome c, mono-and diheme variants [Magnetospirillum fulvum]